VVMLMLMLIVMVMMNVTSTSQARHCRRRCRRIHSKAGKCNGHCTCCCGGGRQRRCNASEHQRKSCGADERFTGELCDCNRSAQHDDVVYLFKSARYYMSVMLAQTVSATHRRCEFISPFTLQLISWARVDQKGGGLPRFAMHQADDEER
jgi:hypothetical protein